MSTHDQLGANSGQGLSLEPVTQKNKDCASTKLFSPRRENKDTTKTKYRRSRCGVNKREGKTHQRGSEDKLDYPSRFVRVIPHGSTSRSSWCRYSIVISTERENWDSFHNYELHRPPLRTAISKFVM